MTDVSTTMATSAERYGGELRRFGVEDAGQPFKVVSPYEPSGDQPQAIDKLSQGIRDGLRYQTLMVSINEESSRSRASPAAWPAVSQKAASAELQRLPRCAHPSGKPGQLTQHFA